MELPVDIIDLYGKYKVIEKTKFFTRLINELPEAKMALLKTIVESIKEDEIIYDKEARIIILPIEKLEEVRLS